MGKSYNTYLLFGKKKKKRACWVVFSFKNYMDMFLLQNPNITDQANASLYYYYLQSKLSPQDPYIHCRVIYSSQDLGAAQVPISRWVDIKAVVHLHNGIVLGRRKEGNLTFWDSMDGPGEYYAMWNKPVSEIQIPYDFTCMWSVMNKIN